MKSVRTAVRRYLSQKMSPSLLSATRLLLPLGGIAAAAIVGLPYAQGAQRPVTRAATQFIDTGGSPISIDAVNRDARAPIDVHNKKEFELRLASGGNLDLASTPLVVAPPADGKRGRVFIAVDHLTLRKGASIVTNGADVVIAANTVDSFDGSIQSFATSDKKAANGAGTGEPGRRGLSGGSVTLIVVHPINGVLHVALGGQAGGDGAQGAPGRDGGPGARGEDAQSGVLGCNHDGGNGATGGEGQRGFTGGAAGPGGDGGSLFVYELDGNPVADAALDIRDLSAGHPGARGVGGNGGGGGPGGLGGSGAGFCHGGHPGASGARGLDGEMGALAEQALDGSATVKAIPLELLIKDTSVFRPR